MKKRILAWIVCIWMVAGLSGCGQGKDWVFSVNGETLYDKEVRAYGIIYANEHSIAYSEQLNEIYEGKTTYQEYYKEQLSDSIVEMLLIYAEAKDKGVKLSEDDKQMAEQEADELVEICGEGWLDTKNITKEELQAVYEKLALGERYLESQTVAEDTEKSDESSDEAEQEAEDERYIRVYQATFPTVELDENGMVVSNQDGEPKSISTAKKEEKRQEAEEFAKAVQAGEDMKQRLKDYDQTVTGMERTLKYADLEASYKKAVDGLSKNQVSDVIVSDYGYYVIMLMESDDGEYVKNVMEYEKAAKEDEKRNEVVEKLLAAYTKSVDEYRNAEMWDEIYFSGFLK